ncbi:MAG: arginine--tRNA ligase [Candidatus Mcinerneyibacterium aminivorans]|uniref:Arginine--tRNA ligase n=1 Tax=Candidatus Mcinerneyibacterium aminivorans TaxID=2703815 RepID=A0A5D0MDH4_9BACT|nr:MAG: arginine--tRNA ligase [Candidatus Mcinerneyibacterium aminivorans]
MLEILENKLKNNFKKIVKKAYPDFDKWETLNIEPATDFKFGDFQTNFAMKNSNYFRDNPRNIATNIINKFKKSDLIENIEVAGPGFINIFIKTEFLSSYIANLEREKLDFSFLDQKGSVIIDYSSPNIAKRMHVGHLRSTVIGDSIKRIYNFLGFHTVADNHLGDWGTHFGKLIVAYRKWLDKENYRKNPVRELERLYVKFNREAEKNKELNNDARKELNKLQEGNKKNKNLWKEFVEVSLGEYKKMYKKLNIEFDTYHGESYYHDIMDDIITILKEKNIAEKDDGALVVFFNEDKNLHPCIVMKKDGSYLYATSELATIKYRIKNYDVNRMVYVTDERQKDHFKQIFEIARKIGWDKKYIHVPFGLMSSKDGVFSSREGNIILMKDLINKALEKAKEVVEEKNPELPESEKRKIAETIGIGAIKYSDLGQNRKSEITFNWDKMLQFEGNTSPYLQYVYVRVQSLFKKAKQEDINYSLDSKIYLNNPTEKQIAIKLSHFPKIVINAAKYYKPNIIADYLFDLAQTYNTFYNSLSILREDREIRDSRLLLSKKVAYIIKTGLNLLGINVVDKM